MLSHTRPSPVIHLDSPSAHRLDPLEAAWIAVQYNLLLGHHVTELGACTTDCPKCLPYRRTPDVEYLEMVKLVRASHEYEHVILINRTRLQVLSEHPLVQPRLAQPAGTTKTVLLEVTLELAHEGRVARVTVRGHTPLVHQQLEVLKAQQESNEGETAGAAVDYTVVEEPELLDRSCPDCSGAFSGEIGATCPFCARVGHGG